VTVPFNPLDMENLAHSIVTRMEQKEATPLDQVGKFMGAGIYAIYYRGSFQAYGRLSALNREGWTHPIYVGKAIPPGGRRGLESVGHSETTRLSERLREHRASIQKVTNLDIEDFAARWLVVEDIWIALGESAMIRRYKPVWNAVLDGFGNHDPGSGRAQGLRTAWDTLHPGRPFATKYPERIDSPATLVQEVVQYLQSRL
jgi:hypothetical protein